MQYRSWSGSIGSPGRSMLAEGRVFGVPDEVMADVKVEVAVVVQVGEGGRGGPVAIAAEAGAIGDILEGPVASVAVKGVRSPAGDEEVGTAVVVEVADGHAMAVTSLHPGDAGPFGGVFKCAVAAVAEQPVAGRRSAGIGRESTALDDVDVEPAVAVVVQQADAAGRGLGKLPERRPAVIEDEPQARGRGVVAELGQGDRLGRPRRRPDGRSTGAKRSCGGVVR